MSLKPPLIEFRNVSKSFGALAANDDLSFSIQPNTIHAFVGENGAGKSTAMKILFGLLSPDEGEIFVRGQSVQIKSPIQARQLGIGMVQQHFVLAPEHTALDNILFSETTKPFQWLNRFKQKKEYQKLAQKYGFAMNWDLPVKDLSVGEQQRIEILKVLRQEAEILILDEPTAVLTPQEVVEFFKNLRQLKAEGKTILLITHKLKEVLAVTDSMTILRKAKVVAELETAKTNQDEVAELMVGRRIRWSRRELNLQNLKNSTPILEISGSPGVDLKLQPQEILGIAGVEGNGQSELIQRILAPIDFKTNRTEDSNSGLVNYELKLCGQSVALLSTAEVRKLSAGVLPEDRLHLGAVPLASVKENFILGYDWDSEFSGTGLKSGWLKWPGIMKVTYESLKTYDVRPLLPEAPFQSFSGGNQQKIVVARELRRQPEFILAAQPTRGVDVGAIEFIHEQLLLAQERGAGILLISTELDELLKLSTRILVLYKGQFVFEVKRDQFDELKIGRAMGGLTP